MDEIVIKPNIIGRIFSSLIDIRISADGLHINRKFGGSVKLQFTDIIDIPVLNTYFFGNKITILSGTKTESIPFLETSESLKYFKEIEANVIGCIESQIIKAREIFTLKAINEYLRNSSITNINNAASSVVYRYSRNIPLWESKLDESYTDTLKSLETYFPLSTQKVKIRKEFELKQLGLRELFFESIESNPLTTQQRLSVIRNNDLNLVLAAAGTGKTSVMVAKALDLIDSGKAKKEDILILAYNKSAAKELKERLLKRGEPFGVNEDSHPEISTFHALGRRILKTSNISTYISRFSEDPKYLEQWVTQWIGNYIKSSTSNLNKFIKLSYQPVNHFDFKTKSEYDAYIRDNEYRTLQGERVKGYQELLIANWLFMNGIEYEYEEKYFKKIRVEEGFDYKPDFHLLKNNIYLEHFGIDRDGNTRPDIDKKKYNQDITNKRNLHIQHETTLIETFHYNWIEGNLENRLLELMTLHLVPINQKTPSEMFEVLEKSDFISRCSKRYLKCLQAIRVEQMDKDSIVSRLHNNKIDYAKDYSELLDDLHSSYVSELKENDEIDFDDMIIRATTTVNDGKFNPRWSHILVDEFQDISMSRMNLLNSLIECGPNPTLTAVGDDWQSIYRFSGGKLELTTRFETKIGPHSLTKLEKTFRYNNSIANTAGTFVMQNPEQYKKEVTTHTTVDEPQVYLMDSMVKSENNISKRSLQIIEKIRTLDKTGSIAILARYNYLINDAKSEIGLRKNIKYWTFHGSKGLEADYCILIGFSQGKLGFPNSNKEEAVVEALLPTLDSFPHSEERRLLYVALTRARHKSYLIADPMATSDFVNELISPKYKLHIASKSFEEKYRKIFKCPICTTGYYRLIQGKFGPFYSCSSGVVCPSKPRVCDKCGSPSIDKRSESVCNNESCKAELNICDKCGRPMKLREGKFGQFLGCSGYGSPNDRCKNTRKILNIL